MFSTAMPDFEMTVERIMSEGDKVVFWVSFSCTQIGHGIIQQLGVILARKKKRNRNRNTNRKEIAMSVIAMCPFSIIQYRQRYIPLVSRCCQRGGEARLSRRAHNPQSGFHFCKIAGGRKFKSTPRYYFFQTRSLSFQCRTSVTALSGACVLWASGYIIRF
jgi:hypothetical protein